MAFTSRRCSRSAHLLTDIPHPVSVFAFISLFLIPIPIAFLRWGPSLRARSAMAKEAGAIVAKMRAQAAAAAKKAQEAAAAAAAATSEKEKTDSEGSETGTLSRLNIVTAITTPV